MYYHYNIIFYLCKQVLIFLPIGLPKDIFHLYINVLSTLLQKVIQPENQLKHP